MAEYVINNFIYGQVSPRMMGRTDLSVYKSALRVLKNFLIYPQSGGLIRRAGSYYVDDALSDESQIFDFVDTLGNSYIIEISGGTVRPRTVNKVYPVIDIATGLGITYSGDDLLEIDYAYMLNQIYFVHRDYEVLKLVYDPSTDTFTASKPFASATGFMAKTGNFTGAGNTPGVVCFKDGRLVLGSNNNYPNAYWMGAVYDSTGLGFEDFAVPTTVVDSSPIEMIIAESRGSIIRSIKASRGLIVITDSSAIEVFYTDGTSFTPLSFPMQRLRSSYGGEQSLAINYDNSIIFVQRGGKRIRTAVMSIDKDIYNAPDLTAFADNIFADVVTKLALQTIPFEVLWFVTADGKLIGMSASTSQNGMIPGWSYHETSGDIKSIAVSSGKKVETVWLIVNRENGTFIEKVSNIEYDNDTYMYLDSAYTWEAPPEEVATLSNDATTGELLITLDTASVLAPGDYIKITNSGNDTIDYDFFQLDPAGVAPTLRVLTVNGGSVYEVVSGNCNVRQAKNTITGVTHLEGQDVGVVVDQSSYSTKTVSSGTVVADVYGCKIIVGLNYISLATPLPVSVFKSIYKRVVSVAIELVDSKGGYIGIGDDEYLLPNRSQFTLDEAFPLYTGINETSVNGKYEYEGSINIIQNDPYPLTVLSVIYNINIANVRSK